MDISVYNIEPLSWLIGKGLVLVQTSYIFPQIRPSYQQNEFGRLL